MTTHQLILQRYNTIIDGKSTQSIKLAEIELSKMEANPSFVPDNAAIICEIKLPIVVRKFAVIYLNKYSKKIVKEKTIHRCTFALQQYLHILKSPHLQIEIKMLLVSPMEVILSAQICKPLKQEFIIEYQRLLNEAEKQDDNEVNFAFIVFCGQALFTKDSYGDDAKEIIKTTIGQLIKLTTRLLVRVNADKSLQNRDSSLALLRVLKESSVLLKQYFKRLALLDIQCMKILFLPDVEVMISLALNFNYQQNQIGSNIFISIPNEETLSKIINITKANFCIMITNFIRILHAFTKHANLFSNNPLYIKIPQILTYCIQTTSSLLQRVPYYQLPHRIMILETLDEVFNFFVSCLRISHFYQSFFDAKLDMIEKIVLPCLSLSPNDIDNFYEDTQEFVHSTLQVVSRDLRMPNATLMSKEEPEQQMKQYETLRTLVAQFLNTFCKFQDGTLSQVVEYALAVINSNSQGQKTLMYLIICILVHQIKERKDLKVKVTHAIIELIKNCSIPVINGTRKQEDLQYAYLLLTLSKIFFFAIEVDQNVISVSYKVGISVIQTPSVNQVHKFFVFEMFNHLARIDHAAKYTQDLLSIYNHLLKNSAEPTIHLLDSYFSLIKWNGEEIKKNPALLIEAIRYICMHIEKEIQKPQPFQILMSKYWNIIRQVGESQEFMPALIEPIEELIVPLLPYINGHNNLDYEEDIILLLTSFIEKGKKVTLNQQKMFQIIPKIFYTQYNRRFGQAFRALQLFIYYGSEVLAQSYPAIESIVDMSLSSISTTEYNKRQMSESDNCEGALILQSLILKCGSFFTVDTWAKIIRTVQKRLSEHIKFNHLASNLYALLSLSLIHSYQFFPEQENEILMTKIISEMRVFNKVQYSSKVIIAGLTELLLKSECGFVSKRFTLILDLVVTLLELTSTKKESFFDQEDDQEKEYSNSIIMLKNDLKQLDEFTYFRQQVEKLKKKNLPLLQQSVSELPKAKKEFFTHILRIERVANEPRQIYRIKR